MQANKGGHKAAIGGPKIRQTYKTNIENQSHELVECDFSFGFSSPSFFHCTQIALYIVLNLYVSLRIFMYLYVPFCIFMYLYVSLCILIYVSFCFWRIFTYLYVSFQPVPEDAYVSFCIFMYLSKPFRKIRTYLYVSLCIFSTGFERYIKIHKDT